MSSVHDVQKLREETGAGIMECKTALSDAKGNIERAKELIEQRGLLKAAKKADRGTGAGLLESYIHNGRVGVLIELRCETDFVAKAGPFTALAKEVVMQIAAMDPENVDALLKQPFIKDESKTLEEMIKGVVAQLGENIRVERFCRFEL